MTNVRSMSSPASVCAMSCATSRLNAPITCSGGCAGFASGPEDIEDGAHAERRAHRRDRLHRRVIVRREQEREVRGGDSTRRAARSSIGILRPSCSSTSAAPARLETERLPCFTTGRPQAATRIAVPVEMFTLPDESPPVPTMSMARTSGGNLGPARQRAHRAREAAQLVRDHAFAAQRREHGAGHGRRRLRIRQLPEQLLRLGLREVAAFEQLFEQLTRKRHARLPPLAQRGARRR